MTFGTQFYSFYELITLNNFRGEHTLKNPTNPKQSLHYSVNASLWDLSLWF